jgi:hypothetical protein
VRVDLYGTKKFSTYHVNEYRGYHTRGKGGNKHIIFRLSYGVKSIGTLPVSMVLHLSTVNRFGQSHCGTTKYGNIVKLGNWSDLKFLDEFESRNSLQNPRKLVKFR